MSPRADKKYRNLKGGDSVTILDTSNNRHREGVVRTVERDSNNAQVVTVWVPRFKRDFTFTMGETGKKRFRLLDWEDTVI